MALNGSGRALKCFAFAGPPPAPHEPSTNPLLFAPQVHVLRALLAQGTMRKSCMAGRAAAGAAGGSTTGGSAPGGSPVDCDAAAQHAAEQEARISLAAAACACRAELYSLAAVLQPPPQKPATPP